MGVTRATLALYREADHAMRLAYRRAGLLRSADGLYLQGRSGVAKAGEVRVVPELIQVLQSLVVLTLAPLYAGVLTRAEAVCYDVPDCAATLKIRCRLVPAATGPYRDI